MAARLRGVDMVIEVRDARAPRSTASSHLEKMLKGSARGQRRVIVINKGDLVSSHQRDQIALWLRNDHPEVPFYFTSASRRDGSSVGVGELLNATVERIKEASPRLFTSALAGADWQLSPTAQAISQAAASANGHSVSPAVAQSLPVVMMVVGVPNVGKSSLINAFRRVSLRKAITSAKSGSAIDRRRRTRSAKPARTGAMPGVTTALNGFQVLQFATALLPPLKDRPHNLRSSSDPTISSHPIYRFHGILQFGC